MYRHNTRITYPLFLKNGNCDHMNNQTKEIEKSDNQLTANVLIV